MGWGAFQPPAGPPHLLLDPHTFERPLAADSRGARWVSALPASLAARMATTSALFFQEVQLIVRRAKIYLVLPDLLKVGGPRGADSVPGVTIKEDSVD